MLLSRRRAAAIFAASVATIAAGLPVLPGCTDRAGNSGPANTGQPRIVVLSPALGVTARDLGLAPLVVGRHGYDLALDRALPVCGDFAGIDYETLLSVRPTHVIIEWGSRPLPERLGELAAGNGWKVEQFSIRTLEDIRASVRRFAEVFSTCEPKAVQMLAAMDDAWRTGKADISGTGSVLLLHTVSPPTALGPGSFHHQILTSIGGAPAITSGSPYMELDAEDLLRLDPSCVLVVSARAPDTPPRASTRLSAEEARAMFGEKLATNLAAVRLARVVVLDDPAALLPSTSMIDLAGQMRRALEDLAAR